MSLRRNNTLKYTRKKNEILKFDIDMARYDKF